MKRIITKKYKKNVLVDKSIQRVCLQALNIGLKRKNCMGFDTDWKWEARGNLTPITKDFENSSIVSQKVVGPWYPDPPSSEALNCVQFENLS